MATKSFLNFVGFVLGKKSQLTAEMSNVICFDRESKQITAQGVDFLPTKKVVAQFGIWWQDMWDTRAHYDSNSYWGDVSDIRVLLNGSTLQLTGNIFNGMNAYDVSFDLVSYEESEPSDVRIAPYKVAGNTLYCKVFSSGTINQGTGFVVKIYK